MRLRRYFLFAMILLSSLYLNSCSKDEAGTITPEEPVAPAVSVATITTVVPHTITTVEAQAGGRVTNNGGATVTERGIVLGTAPSPTVSNIKFNTTTASGDGSFTSRLTGLSASTKYYVRAFAVNAAGIAYGNELSFTTVAIGSATFNIAPLYIIGNSLAHWEVELTADGGDPVTERGLCWSLTENPTIADSKSTDAGKGIGKYTGAITGLQPQTEYNVRAYAKNGGGISYSANMKFKTIRKGSLTYTFNKSASPSTEEQAAYTRLQIAIDSAVWYVNNYTSAVKHVWLNYVPGVATADANNEGWMRFGTGEGYQNLRTMLHELNHTFGTGTTSWWTGKIVGGKYQGVFANDLLNKIQKSTGAQISGDTQHWWPYGLNQNSEVTSSRDYVFNCLLIEQMRRDGLSAAGVWIQ
ncbi:fibronectin type III domain-containing protein [Niabella hibiscisoli]|uniref:fibronectin type III domain-containing protein n=1 Tax=Niabella hibiscisoli TaxID=1825928 RepID=UPI001F0E29DA|nr:fibronectin type III domain-containing protein [Niabella hibiscisoli]MCH5716468.1 fibronectin type III domain-containing protein [Niabella hibiscisoli]